jgi:hypothetical protein
LTYYWPCIIRYSFLYEWFCFKDYDDVTVVSNHNVSHHYNQPYDKGTIVDDSTSEQEDKMEERRGEKMTQALAIW